jgi:hypothetical protein
VPVSIKFLILWMKVLGKFIFLLEDKFLDFVYLPREAKIYTYLGPQFADPCLKASILHLNPRIQI